MSRSASRSSEADIRSNSRWVNASATEKARGLTTLPSPISRASSGSSSLDGSARPWRLVGRSSRRSAVDSGAAAALDSSVSCARARRSVDGAGAMRATCRRQNWSKTAS